MTKIQNDNWKASSWIRLIHDRASGKNTQRPRLEAIMGFVREGDTVIVHSMDRLARNLDGLRGIVPRLTQKGVQVQFIKENLSFTGEDSPMATLILSVMGAFAEFGRALLKGHQRESIAIAKQKGVYKVRKKKLSPEQARILRQWIDQGEKKSTLAKEFGISRETLYQYLEAE